MKLINKIKFSFKLARLGSNLYYRMKLFLFIFFSSVIKFFPIVSRFNININNRRFFVYMSATSDISIFDKIFVQNEYLINPRSKPEIIFDLGSNIGFSVLYFKSLFPDAHIYAFEPNPLVYSKLESNCRGLLNVQCFNVAISNLDGEKDFFVGEKSSLSSSFLKRNESYQSIKVRTRSLDSIVNEQQINNIDLVKFDVEGAEYDVFINCKKLNKIRDLIGEVHIDLGKFSYNGFSKIFNKNYLINNRRISRDRFIFKASSIMIE